MSHPIFISRRLLHPAFCTSTMNHMQTLSFARARRWHPLVYSKSYFSVIRDGGILPNCWPAAHFHGRTCTPNHRLYKRQTVRHAFSSMSTMSEKSEEDAIDGDCVPSENVAEETPVKTTASFMSTVLDARSRAETMDHVHEIDPSTITSTVDPFSQSMHLASRDGWIDRDSLRSGDATTTLLPKESSAEESPTALADLLKTDIFAESWREAEESKTQPAWIHSGSNAMPKDEHTGKLGSMIEHPSNPIERRYNELLQETNDILKSLLDDDVENSSSSALQLMDFDKIMLQWSQFYLEIDRHDGRHDNPVDGSENVADFLTKQRGFADDRDLRRNASDHCMQLLHALEDNYDAIYERYLRSKNNNTISRNDAGPHNHNSSSFKHSKLFPNAASYNLALHALAHSSKGAEVASEAYLIFIRMLDRCQQYRDDRDAAATATGLDTSSSAPLPPPEPNIITYNSVLHAIAKSGAGEAGFLAEQVFARMESWKKECDDRKSNRFESENGRRDYRRDLYHGVLPNARTLACVLDAWVNSRTVHGQSLVPERATAILDTALEKRREFVRRVRGGKVEKYPIAMEDEDDFGCDEASAHSSDIDDIVEETLEDDGITDEIDENLYDELVNDQVSSSAIPLATLQKAEHSTAEIEPFLRPNIVSFNTVLHAWSVSKRGREGALRAHDLLDKVDRMAERGDLDLPDGHHDPTVSPVDVDDESLRADYSLRPNNRSYSIVMNAWANVSYTERDHGEDAASKCEMILNKMEERGAEDASVRPNLAAYTTCISAWARAKHDQAASRAENILNRMIDLYYDEGQKDLPALEGDLENAQHDAPFNAVITAYARSADPNSSDRAFAVLERLEASPILPTATTYNSVMDACAKHGEPERALSILERMQEKSIRPDPTSYDTILNAFARDEKAGSAERAWDFLQRLEDERANGKSNFSPTRISYSSVINAFARASGRKDGGLHIAEKAKEVYDKMIHQIQNGELLGNADPYANSCFINCCANINGPSSEKRAALIMAINAFEDMKRNTAIHGEPNQYTFGTMMKASIKLSSDPDEKNRLLESLFVQACSRGYLSSSILGQFLRNMPTHLSTKAILAQGGSKRDLPQKWYRNIHKKDWPRAMRNSEDNYRKVT